MTHTGIVYAARVPFGNGTEWAWSCTCGKKYAGFREDERACRASGLEHQLTGRSGREIDERVSGGGIVTVQDARERAWKPETATPREKFIFGQGVRHGARLKGREDEQRVTALVAALRKVAAAVHGLSQCHDAGTGAVLCREAHHIAIEVALRALAAQPEEVRP